MSDADQSSYITRFDVLNQTMQYFSGSNWYDVPSSGGLPSGLTYSGSIFSSVDTLCALSSGSMLGSTITWAKEDGDVMFSATMDNSASPAELFLAGNDSDAGNIRINPKNAGTSVVVANTADYVVNSATAILQIDSTSQGILPPRMTTTDRDAITSPAEGLTIYNTSNHALEFYNGTSWKTVATV